SARLPLRRPRFCGGHRGQQKQVATYAHTRNADRPTQQRALRPGECWAQQGLVQPAVSGQAPWAAATWAATSAAKSSAFFSMPSPTTYRVKPLIVVLTDFRYWPTVCLPSAALTNTWSSSDTSLRYFCTEPSTIFATMSAGLPDSAALASATERSRAISSAGTSDDDRATGCIAAMCMATALAATASPSNPTITPMRLPCR